MACTAQTGLLRALHLIHPKAENFFKTLIMVQNSFKYLLKYPQIFKESLAALACNIVKLKLKTAPSLAISHTK